uniref:Uncharacterized protein n=1 Tax=Biomphalaria glabrata TaxID=6526 RepID=A0A2C9KUA7_BIOGL
MYISIAIVYMLLFIDLLAESTMSPTLTLNEKFLKDCQLLSPIFKDKHLCFGGKVSFLTSTPEIGEAVHITVTSADSKITKMSAHIAFDDCGKPPLKTEVLEVCACTSEVGNKSFTYLCAMTFNTSYSGSIINAFLEYLNGSHAKDVLLKLPAINKEESTSIPESTIPQIKQLENSDKCEKVYIGISVPLVFVIVILTICCICLWRQNRRLVKEIQAKDETLTRIQAGVSIIRLLGLPHFL